MKNLLTRQKKEWYKYSRTERLNWYNLTYPDYYEEGWRYVKVYPKMVYQYQIRLYRNWKHNRRNQYKN